MRGLIQLWQEPLHLVNYFFAVCVLCQDNQHRIVSCNRPQDHGVLSRVYVVGNHSCMARRCVDDQQIVGGSNVPLRVVDFFLGGNWHELPLTRQSVDGVSVPPAYLTYSQLLQITAKSGLSAWESSLVKLDEQFLLTLKYSPFQLSQCSFPQY